MARHDGIIFSSRHLIIDKVITLIVHEIIIEYVLRVCDGVIYSTENAFIDIDCSTITLVSYILIHRSSSSIIVKAIVCKLLLLGIIKSMVLLLAIR